MPAIKVASQIASIISATKVVHMAASAAYQWYSASDDEQDQEEMEELEPILICPLTKEAINEPATTRYGNIFEFRAILDYVAKHHECPLSHRPLMRDEVYP